MEHETEVALESLEFSVLSQFTSTYQTDRKRWRQEEMNLIKVGTTTSSSLYKGWISFISICDSNNYNTALVK